MSENSASIPGEQPTSIQASKMRAEADAVVPPCLPDEYGRPLTPGERAVVEARLGIIAALARLDEAELQWWEELRAASSTLDGPLVVANCGYYQKKKVVRVLGIYDKPGQVHLVSQGGPTTVRHLAPPTCDDLEAYETEALLKLLERRNLTQRETQAIKAVLRLSQPADGEPVTTTVVGQNENGLPKHTHRFDELVVPRRVSKNDPTK